MAGHADVLMGQTSEHLPTVTLKELVTHEGVLGVKNSGGERIESRVSQVKSTP